MGDSGFGILENEREMMQKVDDGIMTLKLSKLKRMHAATCGLICRWLFTGQTASLFFWTRLFSGLRINNDNETIFTFSHSVCRIVSYSMCTRNTLIKLKAFIMTEAFVLELWTVGKWFWKLFGLISTVLLIQKIETRFSCNYKVNIPFIYNYF